MQVSVTFDYNAALSPATKRAAINAFGPQITSAFNEVLRGSKKEIRVLATADQLVAFQVARDELGGQNLWKALKVKILRPSVNNRGQTIYYDAIRGQRVYVR